MGKHLAEAKHDTMTQKLLNQPARGPEQQERRPNHNEDEVLEHVHAEEIAVSELIQG